MSSDKGHILILEDDVSFSTALKTAFEKEGFRVTASARPEEIIEALESGPVAAFFVDVLLPQGNGIEIVQSLRKQYPATVLDVIIMSGLFTDGAFVRDATRSTSAVAFLKKPFNLQEAISKVKVMTAPPQSAEEAEAVHPRKALYSLFAQTTVSKRKKIKVIEALEEIHGFDLPYLFSLLAETKTSGHLNLANPKGEISGVTFSQGCIVQVDILDQETYLGNLLIEAGFLTPEDLKEALNVASSKKLGERLIQGNLLSPHAFQIALANQMSIRLSRTIIDGIFKVNLVLEDVPLTEPSIDSEALGVFLHDWVASKIYPSWLKAHYTQWLDYGLKKSANFTDDNSTLKSPLLANLHGVVDFVCSGQTIEKMIDQKKYPEDSLYKAIHLLLTRGLLVFGEKSQIMDDQARLKYLKRIHAQLQGKNKLDLLDLMARMVGGSDSDPDFVHAEFKRLLGDEPRVQGELAQVYHQLKQMAQDVNHFAKTGDREKLKEEIAKSDLEMKLKAASLFEEAKALLQKAQFDEARIRFEKAQSIDSQMDKMRLYGIWLRLGLAEGHSAKMQVVKDVEVELASVPPEEKFDALYSFVMGLLSKLKGDLPGARKCFEKALNLDSTLIVARREIALLSSQNPVKKDVLNRDLKDLVAGFFKKRA